MSNSKKQEVINEVVETEVTEVVKPDLTGLSKEEAMNLLVPLLGFAKAGKYWKEKGKGNSGNVFAKFLTFLSEGTTAKTESELAEFLLNGESDNECRWFNQRNSIRLVTVDVFGKFEAEFTEVKASETQLSSLKARWSK